MRLDERAHRAGGSLGLEGDGAVALVVERVHFLLHHVGGVAHAALEQLGVLEDGRADLAIARQRADAAHVVLDGLPAIRVLRQHVQSALGCLGQHVGKTPFVIEWRKQKTAFVPIAGAKAFAVPPCFGPKTHLHGPITQAARPTGDARGCPSSGPCADACSQRRPSLRRLGGSTLPVNARWICKNYTSPAGESQPRSGKFKRRRAKIGKTTHMRLQSPKKSAIIK